MNENELRLLEELCRNAMNNPKEDDRRAADQQIQTLVSVANIQQLKFAVEHSQDKFCQFFGLNSIIRLIDNQWSAMSHEINSEFRRWMLDFLASKGNTIHHNVLKELTVVIARLSKACWLEDPEFHQIPIDLCKMVMESDMFTGIGLATLCALIVEFNRPNPKRSLSVHRKSVHHFRENCLLGIFRVSLLKLAEHQQTGRLNAFALEQAINLALNCLSFDFVGILPDETSDDVFTVQIPASWREQLIDGSVNLFFDLYAKITPPLSVLCLRNIVQLVSVRRTLFSSDEEKMGWITSIMKGMIIVLAERKGLEQEDNHHEFCRLISRVKPNYQLSELVAVDCYPQWIEQIAKFTLDTMMTPEVGENSCFFLMQLWGKLVASLPYLKAESSPALVDGVAGEIAKVFIESRLHLARLSVIENYESDPLEDKETLLGLLESVPILIQFQYEKLGWHLNQLFTPCAEQYKGLCESGRGSSQEAKILEKQLAWLTYITGSVVGHTGVSRSPDADAIDGELSGRLLSLLSIIQGKRTQEDLKANSTLEKLEIATIYFLQQFRKSYISEASMPCSKIYPQLKQILHLEDHLQVLEVIVHHMISTLHFWSTNAKIVCDTMSLFCDLSSGCSSARCLLKLPTIQKLFNIQQKEPFFNSPQTVKHRTKYYRTITNLLFTETHSESEFERFMGPLAETVTCLQNNLHESSRDQMRGGVVGLLRDLRGINSACQHRDTFLMFFEWMYPYRTEVLRKIAQIYAADHFVMVPLLKFYAGFVHNRLQRVMFECSSPNGILLFREASSILVTYAGEALNAKPPPGQVYEAVYKGFHTCMTIMARALSGNYCNFGAMTLYKDTALESALACVIQMSLSIPINDVASYSKLGMANFTLLEILFQNHCQTIIMMETDKFMQIMRSLEFAIKSTELNRQAVCNAAAAIGHIATFYFNNVSKNTRYAPTLQNHFQGQTVFAQILTAIFNIILFEECTNQWSMSRPLLPLILLNQQVYTDYMQHLMYSLAEDKRQKLMTAFQKLMEGVEPTLETKNRDRFTANLTTFRHQAKSIL